MLNSEVMSAIFIKATIDHIQCAGYNGIQTHMVWVRVNVFG